MDEHKTPSSHQYLRLILCASRRNAGSLSRPVFYIRPPLKDILEFKIEHISMPTIVLPEPEPFYIVCSSALSSRMLDCSYVNGYVNEAVCVVPTLKEVNDKFGWNNFSNGSSHDVYSKKPIDLVDIYLIDGGGNSVEMIDDWGVVVWLKTSLAK